MVNSVRAAGGLQLWKPSTEEDWPNIIKRVTCTLKTQWKVSALRCGHSQLVSVYLSLQSKNWALGYSVAPLFPYKVVRVALQGHYCGWERGPSPGLLHSQQHRRAARGSRFQLSGSRVPVPAFLTASCCCGATADI